MSASRTPSAGVRFPRPGPLDGRNPREAINLLDATVVQIAAPDIHADLGGAGAAAD
ncbi:hypothetical protein ABZ379_09700 [Streptomyces canus]|uniref:hypothetical protein n=1 Tax=Streptomyces canus TaxID=58343 RepID=UPI0033F55314